MVEKEVKVALIGGCITLIGIILSFYLSHQVSQDTSVGSLPITWKFLEGLDGWERTGTTLPWKTLSDSVVWYNDWGDGDGVIVFDACDRPSTGANASTGITINVKVPSEAKYLVADILKEKEDGGIRFIITDYAGDHVIGEEHLSGREKKTVSYSIVNWAGQTVVIKIMGFGWGVATEHCSEVDKACCGEYIGLDRVEII